ncbi:unnamed protein product [Nesidiocoris tenuis]|uniref:Uncharacterized protein n=1 Tax=Nesidiocoris tenuis TaxID=355587 RepID=A0A6H5HNU9_9HEMI|nr:unnamed protein product [Nesidiocoris tenuis]
MIKLKGKLKLEKELKRYIAFRDIGPTLSRFQGPDGTDDGFLSPDILRISWLRILQPLPLLPEGSSSPDHFDPTSC